MVLEELVPGEKISFGCYVHKIKRAGSEKLIYIRAGKYLLQATHEDAEGICEGAYIRIHGVVKEEKRADTGIEIKIDDYEIYSVPQIKHPVNVFGKTLDLSNDLKVANRMITIRHPEMSNIFRMNSVVTEAFVKFCSEKRFVAIHTPRIVPSAYANDKRTFGFDYFDKEAYLARNPQFYKQASAAALGGVYEVSSVFKNEKRNSARHLNEFTRFDVEFSFPESMEDVIKTEAEMLKYIISCVDTECKHELEVADKTLPGAGEIPVISFNKVFDILGKACIQSTLDPTDEVRICEYVKNEYDSDFVFITGFPDDKQPFYNIRGMGFVLLFRGVEISNGGCRIYNHDDLKDKIREKEIDEECVQQYIDLVGYGMPPMGGFSVGLERFVMQLLGLKNIRSASMFPRDIHHMP